jgi:glyceraldehyde-3-phosphate dehydrogenase/erythrose-4-phosphate dehydrogenase
LLEFDSTYVRLAAKVESADTIAINAKPIAALNVREPAAIGWADQGADIVIGHSRGYLPFEAHRRATARRRAHPRAEADGIARRQVRGLRG